MTKQDRKMVRRKGECRLCSQQANLCNSHVIPEFFYEQMQLYDDKHRFNVLSTMPGKHPPSAQKGIRESLLCKECECKFSRWEDYARRVLYGGECVEVTPKLKGFEFAIDYAKFKLFQLSIVWRLGVARHAAFSSIVLGEHENVLKRMLLGGAPGNTEAYGCVILYSSKNNEFTSNLIHCMGMLDVKGVTCARLLLGGYFWQFFLSEKAVDPRQKELFLQDTGHLRILRTNEDPNGYIESLARDFYNADPDRFVK